MCKGNTPLITAAEYGHAPIVEYLIQNNANLNAQNTDGKFFLSISSFLLKSYFFFSFSILGHTPLTIAMENGHENVVKLLMEHGAYQPLPLV